MSRHGDAIRQGLEELGGSGTLNDISFQTCIALPTIRYHLELHSTRDYDTGEWVDAFSYSFIERDGQRVCVYSLTGKDPL